MAVAHRRPVPPGPSYYSILNVNVLASPEDIRKAYLLNAKLYHPDRATQDGAIREEATRRFQAIAVAFSVLSNREAFLSSLSAHGLILCFDATAEKRRGYDQALVDSYRSPSTALAAVGSSPRAPSPRPGHRANFNSTYPAVPDSPLWSNHANPFSTHSPYANANDNRPPPPSSYHEPLTTDPFALFDRVVHQQEEQTRSNQGQGFEESCNEPKSRVGAKGDIHDFLKDVLAEDDPLLMPGQWETSSHAARGGSGGSRRHGPWENPPDIFGPTPWGRSFTGEVNPARGGRGRQMSAVMSEGEKRSNGDYHTKKAEHYVEQGADGSIKWTSYSVATRFVSGQPHRTDLNRRRSLTQSGNYDERRGTPPSSSYRPQTPSSDYYSPPQQFPYNNAGVNRLEYPTHRRHNTIDYPSSSPRGRPDRSPLEWPPALRLPQTQQLPLHDPLLLTHASPVPPRQRAPSTLGHRSPSLTGAGRPLLLTEGALGNLEQALVSAGRQHAMADGARRSASVGGRGTERGGL